MLTLELPAAPTSALITAPSPTRIRDLPAASPNRAAGAFSEVPPAAQVVEAEPEAAAGTLQAPAPTTTTMDAKTRDAIIGGVVGGTVGVAGLVAGLAAGLTAHGSHHVDPSASSAWTTLTSTTRAAVALVDDEVARQAMDVRPQAVGSTLMGPGAVHEPGQLPWMWLGLASALVVVLSLALLYVFRRTRLAGTARKAQLAAGDWSGSSSPGSSSGPESPGAASPHGRLPGAAEGRGGAGEPWDRLFDMLDSDGDGEITREDLKRAPAAARAAAGLALSGNSVALQPGGSVAVGAAPGRPGHPATTPGGSRGASLSVPPVAMTPPGSRGASISHALSARSGAVTPQGSRGASLAVAPGAATPGAVTPSRSPWA